MLELEGGEGIINKKAMASIQMVKIDGKEMTICGEGIINKKAMASIQMVKIDGKEMTICEAAMKKLGKTRAKLK